MAHFPSPPTHTDDLLSFLKTFFPPPKDLHPSSASICEGESTLDSIHSSSFSICEDDLPIPRFIQEKIRYALENLLVKDRFRGLIQFWAPLKIAGRWILTTSDQPALPYYDTNEDSIEKYRSCCVKYKYNIDDVDKVQVEEDLTIISSGTPATAFLNRMPEYDLIERGDLMSPLESSAWECGLFHSVVLPVFYPSQSCCVGVVQCSATSDYHLLRAFNNLNVELEVWI